MIYESFSFHDQLQLYYMYRCINTNNTVKAISLSYCCINCINTLIHIIQLGKGMRQDAVTREEIFQVADELFAQGINPTQVKIRERLGKGSYATINKYLREWRNLERNIANTNAAIPLPEDFQKEALNLFYTSLSKLWTKAVIKAEETQVNEMVALLEKENQQLRNELMNYNEMKGRVEASEAIQSQLLATVEKQGRQMEQRDREVEQLKQALENIIQEKNQNK